jgi:hypothetical protein
VLRAIHPIVGLHDECPVRRVRTRVDQLEVHPEQVGSEAALELRRHPSVELGGGGQPGELEDATASVLRSVDVRTVQEKALRACLVWSGQTRLLRQLGGEAFRNVAAASARALLTW